MSDSIPQWEETETVGAPAWEDTQPPGFEDLSQGQPLRLRPNAGFVPVKESTTQGGPRRPLASYAETMSDVQAGVETPLMRLAAPQIQPTEPRVNIPRIPIDKNDPWWKAAASESVNAVMGLPEFFTSDLGIASAIAGKLAPRLVSAGFTADLATSAYKQAKQTVQGWGQMTPAQKAVAVVDTLASGLMAGATGAHAAGLKMPGPTPEEKEAFLGAPDWSQTVPPPEKAWAGTFGAETGLPPAETEMVRTSPDVFGGGRFPFIPREQQPPAIERPPDARSITSPESDAQREVRPPVGGPPPLQQPGQVAPPRPPEVPAQAPPSPGTVQGVAKPPSLRPALLLANGEKVTGPGTHENIFNAELAKTTDPERKALLIEAFNNDAKAGENGYTNGRGFIDQDGNFKTREEGAPIFQQIRPDAKLLQPGRLHSEDLIAAGLHPEAPKSEAAPPPPAALEEPVSPGGYKKRGLKSAVEMRQKEPNGSLANYDAQSQGEWLAGKPPADGKVTLYRATPTGEPIGPGDYVTNSKAYAQQHIDSNLGGEGRITSIEATLDDIYPADGPKEFWYAPKGIEKPAPPAAPVETAPAPQGTQAPVYYHGTKADYQDTDIATGKRMFGIHLTTDEVVAKDYGKVKQFTIAPDAKTLDLSDGDVLWDFMQKQDILDEDQLGDLDLENYVLSGRLFQYDIASKTRLADDVAKTAKSLGYDVVKLPDDLDGRGDNIAHVVVNEKVLRPAVKPPPPAPTAAPAPAETPAVAPAAEGKGDAPAGTKIGREGYVWEKRADGWYSRESDGSFIRRTKVDAWAERQMLKPAKGVRIVKPNEPSTSKVQSVPKQTRKRTTGSEQVAEVGAVGQPDATGTGQVSRVRGEPEELAQTGRGVSEGQGLGLTPPVEPTPAAPAPVTPRKFTAEDMDYEHGGTARFRWFNHPDQGWMVIDTKFAGENFPAKNRVEAVKSARQLNAAHPPDPHQIIAPEAAPAPGTKAKEPWEMTFGEWNDIRRGGNVEAQDALEQGIIKTGLPPGKRTHEQVLKWAVKQGKTIPQSVLDEARGIAPAPGTKAGKETDDQFLERVGPLLDAGKTLPPKEANRYNELTKGKEKPEGGIIAGEGEITTDQAKAIRSVAKTGDIVSKLESLKIKPGPEGVASFPDPEIFKQIGRDVWNTTIDLAIQGVKAGRAIAELVDEAVAYIRTKVQQFDEDRVRAALQAQLSRVEEASPAREEAKPTESPVEEELKRLKESARSIHQVAGVHQGGEYDPANVEKIRQRVKQYFDASKGVTPERTQEAFDIVKEFTDPLTGNQAATDFANKTGELGSSSMLFNELWDYAQNMLLKNKDASLYDALRYGSAEFSTTESVNFGKGGIYASALNMVLRGQIMRGGFGRILEYTNAILEAANRTLGEGPKAVENLMNAFKEISAKIDPEEWDKLIITGKDSKERTLQDIIDSLGPESKAAEEITQRNLAGDMSQHGLAEDMSQPLRGAVYNTVRRYLLDYTYPTEQEARFKQDLKADLMTALGADLAKHRDYDRLAANIANDAWLRKTQDLDITTKRLMDAEYRKLDDQAASTADAEIRKLNNIHLPTGVPDKVRDILRDFLSSKRPIDNEKEFKNALETQLIEAGVPRQPAISLARDIYDKRVTNWTHARAVAMERASRSNRVTSLIEDIKSAPYLLQQDRDWMVKTAENWFKSNGLESGAARDAAKIFEKEWRKAYADAQIKIARQLLKKPDLTLPKLITAIRAGLTDPNKKWPEELAKRSGFLPLTAEQHQRLAQLDQAYANPALSPEEQVDLVEKMAGIYRHTGDQQGHFMRTLAEALRASLLGGFKTIALHIFQPPVTLFANLMVSGPFEPKDFKFLCGQMKAAFAMYAPQAHFSWLHDAHSFSVGQMGMHTNRLKLNYELAQKLWSAGEKASKEGKTLEAGKLFGEAAARFSYGSMQYTIRSLMTANQAGMRVTQRWYLALYGSRVLRDAGYGPKEIREMVDHSANIRKAAYQDALQTHTPLDAAAIADHWANEALTDSVAKQTGDAKAALKAKEAAYYETFSGTGRLAPGIGERDEAMLSLLGPVQLMELTKRMHREGGGSSMLNTGALGFVNIPLRMARYMANWSTYGGVRYGIHTYMQNPNNPGAHWLRTVGRDLAKEGERRTFWQQSYHTDLQARQHLHQAIAGTAVMLAFGAWQHFHHTSDDDAEKRPFGLFFTGHGPSNRTMLDSWKKRGFRPFSLNVIVGGRVLAAIPITRTGIVLSYVGIWPAAADDLAWKRKEDIAAGRKPGGISRDIGMLASEFLEVTGAQGIGQAFAHITQLQRGGSGMLRAVGLEAASVAGGLLPWHGTLNSIEGMMFGQVDRSTTKAAMIASIPFLNVAVNGQAINRFGDQLGDRSWYARMADTGIPISFRVSDSTENKALYQMVVDKGAAPPDLRRATWEERYGEQPQRVWNKYAKLSGDILKKSLVDNLDQLQSLPAQAVREFMVSAAESANAQAAMTMNLEPVPSARGSMARAGGGGGGSGASLSLPKAPTSSSLGLPQATIGSGGAGSTGVGTSAAARGASASVPSSGGGGITRPGGSGRIVRSAGRLTRPRVSAPARRAPRLVSGRLRARSGRLHRIKLARGKKGHRISFKG